MSEFTERLRDYGLTLDERVIIHDRRVVDEAADIIDTMERALKYVADSELLAKSGRAYRTIAAALERLK